MTHKLPAICELGARWAEAGCVTSYGYRLSEGWAMPRRLDRQELLKGAPAGRDARHQQPTKFELGDQPPKWRRCPSAIEIPQAILSAAPTRSSNEAPRICCCSLGGRDGRAARAAAARSRRRLPVIGFLSSIRSPGEAAGARLQRVPAGGGRNRLFGYIEGQNLAIEFRWAEALYDRACPPWPPIIVGRKVERESANHRRALRH